MTVVYHKKYIIGCFFDTFVVYFSAATQFVCTFNILEWKVEIIREFDVVPVESGLAIVVHYNFPGRKTSRAKNPTGAQYVISFVDTNGSSKPCDWTKESKTALRIPANLGTSIKLDEWLRIRGLMKYKDAVIEKQTQVTKSASYKPMTSVS